MEFQSCKQALPLFDMPLPRRETEWYGVSILQAGSPSFRQRKSLNNPRVYPRFNPASRLSLFSTLMRPDKSIKSPSFQSCKQALPLFDLACTIHVHRK